MKPTMYKRKVKSKDGSIKIYQYLKCYDNKVICDCGGKYTHTNKSKHFETIKHNKYLNTIENNEI